MPVQRGYRQGCGIARALDLVGERWALLIVRELLLGPKRFTDLQAAMPTASPNALSDRLRELTGHQIIRRRRLPAPASAQVYELTAWGRGLEPIVLALGTWALGVPARPDQSFVSIDSVMLSVRTYYRPSGPQDATAVVAVELSDLGERGRFGVWLSPDGADVHHAVPDECDATVITDSTGFLTALDEHPRVGGRAFPAMTVDGDRHVVQRLIDGVHFPESVISLD